MAEFDSKRRHINWTDADLDNYGIFPDGDDLAESYIDGSEERKYVCSVIIRKFSRQDAERLKNSEFMERLQRWFNKQTKEKNLPQLPEGMEAIDITAANAMLTELDLAGKYGRYSMQIIMNYYTEEEI